ncbi:LysR family transcriptional regulator [Mameliella sediminis]|uniref:LysR family transcriptional regulator n=1 Tax=Mameliella sediminis TaxID=2836866 RepID=UPI001C44D46A|nr:LysR family transcriptional regulator [Mameliella sediminis]MBV7392620.1 LysR family transcriptional regulator [Mameliella sediminis]
MYDTEQSSKGETMRLPLATLEVFTAIARHGSLRAAADALGLKPSTVSHQLKTLEDQLGTALFIRTTRSISLTEAGRALIRGTGPAFDQLGEAVESARTTGHAARGTLKLAMPEFAYQLFLGARLRSFCETYPEIEIELSLTDAFSDLPGEELHAGFRLGDRIAQDMVAVRLTPGLPLAVVASPAYLARHGAPVTPRDLLDHSCIRYRFQTSGRIAAWSFAGKDGPYDVAVRGNLVVNTLPAMIDLARQDLGLVYTFRDYFTQDIAQGRLEEVLHGTIADAPGIYLYFPREYRAMMPLRLLMDHLRGKQPQG